MARQKNKILMFLFSLIPGAGQMYMGFMKQGLSLMTIFATLCAVGYLAGYQAAAFLCTDHSAVQLFRCNQQEFDGRRSV